MELLNQTQQSECEQEKTVSVSTKLTAVSFEIIDFGKRSIRGGSLRSGPQGACVGGYRIYLKRAHHQPILCLFFLFALAPTYARPECGKRSSHRNTCYAGQQRKYTLPFSISSSSSFSFFPVCPPPLSQLCILPVIAEQYPGVCAGSEFQYSSDHLPAIRKKTHKKTVRLYISSHM